jgi:hypothetical protein
MSASSLLTLLLVAAGPAPDDPARRAEAAFTAGDYEAAASAAAEAHVATGDPKYLYAQAQAERFGGRCDLAVEHYRSFITLVPSSDATLAAQDNIAECEALLAAAPAPAPVEPLGPAEPEPADEPVDAPRPRHWARDPVGGVLVGAGVVVLGVGGGLYGQAKADERAAMRATDVVAYGERIDRAYTLSRVGVPVMIIGGALVVGGVVRWVVLARRNARSQNLARIARIARFAQRLQPAAGGVLLRF